MHAGTLGIGSRELDHFSIYTKYYETRSATRWLPSPLVPTRLLLRKLHRTLEVQEECTFPLRHMFTPRTPSILFRISPRKERGTDWQPLCLCSVVHTTGLW